MAAQRTGGDEGQAARSPWRIRRRSVVTVTAAAVVLAGGVLAVDHFTTSSNTASRAVNGNTVEYTAGHQPLVPDITATSLTGTPIKMTTGARSWYSTSGGRCARPA